MFRVSARYGVRCGPRRERRRIHFDEDNVEKTKKSDKPANADFDLPGLRSSNRGRAITPPDLELVDFPPPGEVSSLLGVRN